MEPAPALPVMQHEAWRIAHHHRARGTAGTGPGRLARLAHRLSVGGLVVVVSWLSHAVDDLTGLDVTASIRAQILEYHNHRCTMCGGGDGQLRAACPPDDRSSVEGGWFHLGCTSVLCSDCTDPDLIAESRWTW